MRSCRKFDIVSSLLQSRLFDALLQILALYVLCISMEIRATVMFSNQENLIFFMTECV
jgi:hypothetical protein